MKTWGILIAFVGVIFLSACSDNNKALLLTSTATVTEKSGVVRTEAEMAADASLGLTSENNVVIALEDPDLIGDQTDTTSGGNDTGNIRGTDIIPLDISVNQPYLFCKQLQEDIDDDIRVDLLDSNNAVIMSIEDESCLQLQLSPGRYYLAITRISDNLGGTDMLFFVTMEGATINIKHNQCQYCDLENVDLSGKRLEGTDFKGAKLKGADFSNTVLEFVNFSFTNLDAAIFDNADSINTQMLTTGYTGATERLRGRSMYVNNLGVSFKVLAILNIQHTYPVVIEQQTGKDFRWGALGGYTGGVELSGTRTDCADGCINLETVSFIMRKAPCAWPKQKFYAVVGVCWNLTNRGLYYTGKTVHEIPYYAAVETYFGTYGLDDNSTCVWVPFVETPCQEGRRVYSWSKCLAAVEADHPWNDDTSKTKTSNANKMADAWATNPLISTVEVDPRIHLYETLLADPDRKAMSAGQKENFYLDYLQELLMLNIQENVGDVDASVVDSLLVAHEDMFYSVGTIQADNKADYTKRFNEIMNQTMDRYRVILGKENYMKLMNIEADVPFDVRNHVLPEGV